jgi:acylphosphatase
MTAAADGMQAPVHRPALAPPPAPRACQNPCMSNEPIRRRAVVHGNVQGVFFRDSTREQAERQRLGGWARNRPDGAVEVVVEGPPDAVEGLLAFLRDGPRRASVDRVDVTEEEPEGLSAFEVR